VEALAASLFNEDSIQPRDQEGRSEIFPRAFRKSTQGPHKSSFFRITPAYSKRYTRSNDHQASRQDETTFWVFPQALDDEWREDKKLHVHSHVPSLPKAITIAMEVVDVQNICPPIIQTTLS
jgi:hypothetical protein